MRRKTRIRALPTIGELLVGRFTPCQGLGRHSKSTRCAAASSSEKEKINMPAENAKHVVLLMMENHSFDQMLGCVQSEFPKPQRRDVDSNSPRFNLARAGIRPTLGDAIGLIRKKPSPPRATCCLSRSCRPCHRFCSGLKQPELRHRIVLSRLASV